MTRNIYSKVIFENGTAEVLETYGAEQIKIQGIGSGSYALKGRLSADCAWDSICVIKASDLSQNTTVSDTSVWVADISGYAHITVEASGFTKIYATVLG